MSTSLVMKPHSLSALFSALIYGEKGSPPVTADPVTSLTRSGDTHDNRNIFLVLGRTRPNLYRSVFEYRNTDKETPEYA